MDDAAHDHRGSRHQDTPSYPSRHPQVTQNLRGIQPGFQRLYFLSTQPLSQVPFTPVIGFKREFPRAKLLIQPGQKLPCIIDSLRRVKRVYARMPARHDLHYSHCPGTGYCAPGNNVIPKTRLLPRQTREHAGRYFVTLFRRFKQWLILGPPPVQIIDPILHTHPKL